MEKEVRLIDADSLKERFLIVAQSGGPVVVHVSDICAAIEDEIYEGTVDAVPVVHGRWEVKRMADIKMVEVKCSACAWLDVDTYDAVINYSAFSYCPNCGAKMDGASLTIGIVQTEKGRRHNNGC